MNRLKTAFLILLSLLSLPLLFAPASADPAEDLTPGCVFRVADNWASLASLADGRYASRWESTLRENPWVTLASDRPVYGLYLCFHKMPESYVIQEQQGENWVTVIREDCPRYPHVFYELNGAHTLRILSAAEGKSVLAFNEIFVFGPGEIPGWVQRWSPPAEKADLLLLAAHPDDELLFFGGTVPVYAAEKRKKVQVVYLTCNNGFRRSEALNGLWAMGLRNYPEFGPFSDRYPEGEQLSDAYLMAGGQPKVLEWLADLFRKYRPDVVVTHAESGEYGHPQHKMAADASVLCYDLAADASFSPASAEQYGVWQVRKLYLHLYGPEEEQTVLNWDLPLSAFGGKTGAQLAAEAFSMHVTQKGAGIRRNGGYVEFTVGEFGAKLYPYNRFGLYASTVGADVEKNDFTEHLPQDPDSCR